MRSSSFLGLVLSLSLLACAGGTSSSSSSSSSSGGGGASSSGGGSSYRSSGISPSSNPSSSGAGASFSGNLSSGEVACGSTKCGPTEYCVIPCCHGIQPCVEPVDGGGCPTGTRAGSCWNGSNDVLGCYVDCARPPVCEVWAPQCDAGSCYFCGEPVNCGGPQASCNLVTRQVQCECV